MKLDCLVDISINLAQLPLGLLKKGIFRISEVCIGTKIRPQESEIIVDRRLLHKAVFLVTLKQMDYGYSGSSRIFILA